MHDAIKKLEAATEATLAPLIERIAALEARRTMHFRGTWLREEAYGNGDVVVFAGGLWACVAGRSTAEPAESTNAWKNIVKRGRVE